MIYSSSAIQGAGLQLAEQAVSRSDMDNRSFETSKSPLSHLDSAAARLEIASALVAPSSFLFNQRTNTPPSPPASQDRTASWTMDKTQQPSSFQQLEKVPGSSALVLRRVSLTDRWSAARRRYLCNRTSSTSNPSSL